MFHQGDLQSGIATAIQQDRYVVCFVTDDSQLAHTWEEWLGQRSRGHDRLLEELLSQKAVLLRIAAGSQEAGFLSAFAPIHEAPCLIVIHNGQLKLRLSPEFEKAFVIGFLKATLLGQQESSVTHGGPAVSEHSHPEGPSPEPSSLPTTLQPNALERTGVSPPAASASGTSTQPSASPSHTPISPSSEGEPSAPQSPVQRQQTPPSTVATASTVSDPTGTHDAAVVRSLLEERGRRLEAERKKREEAEKAERIAKAKAKREAAEAAEASSSQPGSGLSAEASYAAQQAQRRREARKERERILKQIEDDKREREAKEELRRALAKAEAETLEATKSEDVSTAETKKPHADSCAIQVRLFDGSTIRSRFPTAGTIRSEVRPWIDRARTDDTPYTLKQILAPQPSRLIEVSEEELSLRDLRLTPTATLVMVPVQGSVSAYSYGTMGIIFKGISAGYELASSSVARVTGGLNTFLGMGGGAADQRSTAQNPQPSSESQRPASSGSGIRIRTLRDQNQDRDEQQLYNGNHLNFEPRKKDEDD